MNELRKTSKKGTLEWMLANDDWSDLNAAEIAEVLGKSPTQIVNETSSYNAFCPDCGTAIDWKPDPVIESGDLW